MQQFQTFCWHELETPEFACKFVLDINEIFFGGKKLTASGIYASEKGFKETMEVVRKYLTENGVLIQQQVSVPIFLSRMI